MRKIFFQSFFFLYNGFGLALLTWHQHKSTKKKTRTQIQRVYYTPANIISVANKFRRRKKKKNSITPASVSDRLVGKWCIEMKLMPKHTHTQILE